MKRGWRDELFPYKNQSTLLTYHWKKEKKHKPYINYKFRTENLSVLKPNNLCSYLPILEIPPPPKKNNCQ